MSNAHSIKNVPDHRWSSPVEIQTVSDQTLGTAALTFNQDDGEPTIKVLTYGPEAHGTECFFIVELGSNNAPTPVLAFRLGDYAPVGPDILQRFWFSAQGDAPVSESPNPPSITATLPERQVNDKHDNECPIAAALIHATALRLNYHEIQNLRNNYKNVLPRPSDSKLAARAALLAENALSRYAPEALLSQNKPLAAHIILDEPDRNRAATLAEELGTAMSHQTKSLGDPYTQHPHPRHAAALACIHAAKAHREALQSPPYQNLPTTAPPPWPTGPTPPAPAPLPEINSLLRQMTALR